VGTQEPTSPYLAFLEAVLLLGSWDDLEGDGSLGLGLKGEGTEAYCPPGSDEGGTRKQSASCTLTV
jgi:hypothetical protein